MLSKRDGLSIFGTGQPFHVAARTHMSWTMELQNAQPMVERKKITLQIVKMVLLPQMSEKRAKKGCEGSVRTVWPAVIVQNQASSQRRLQCLAGTS